MERESKHIQLARELRDRFLEQVVADPSLLLPAGKFEVARAALPGPEAAGATAFIEVKALPAAA